MRDFSSSTLKLLAKRGVRVIGSQAAPAFEGDQAFSGKAYRLDDNGCGKVRSHSEVLEMAR